MRNKSREEYVQEFLEAADQHPTFAVVWDCLGEEFLELQEAASNLHTVYTLKSDEAARVKARANFVKEWADVQYVLSQLAVFYEIDGEEAFLRVANNNMTKIPSDGKVRRREDGKILKPEGYEPPNMEGI